MALFSILTVGAWCLFLRNSEAASRCDFSLSLNYDNHPFSKHVSHSITTLRLAIAASLFSIIFCFPNSP
jgi:hypothetical protein